MTYTDEDVKLLAKCGWMEGRNGGRESMRAVMHVVINRMSAPNFARTVSGVILAPNAFSWTRPDDPEYKLDPSVAEGEERIAWLDAWGLASTILNGNDADNTDGALYYWKPSWFARHIAGDPANHPFTVEVGGQMYYK